MIEVKNTLNGKINASIIKEYPELEEITITPTLDGQELESSKYGYSKIKVKAIPATDVTLEPSEEQQNLKGIFKEVNINPIQVEEITTDLDFSSSDAIELTAQEGAYIKKATINKDANLSPENIKSGVTVCGVSGDVADTTDADATSSDIAAGKTAYVNNEKVTGTMEVSECNALVATTIEAGSYQTSYRGAINNVHKIIKKIDEKIILVSTSAAYLFAGCSNLEEVKEIDTSNSTDFTGTFSGCSNLKISPVLDMIKATSMSSTYENCSSLEIAPEIINNTAAGTSYLFSGCTNLKDASRLTGLKTNNMYGMFMNDAKLENVSQFETSNVNNIQNAFSGCTSLTDESLNNILAICIPVTKLASSSYYNLKHIGLTSDQATRCQSLSNYQAFLDAGWVTGY